MGCDNFIINFNIYFFLKSLGCYASNWNNTFLQPTMEYRSYTQPTAHQALANSYAWCIDNHGFILD